MLRTRTIDKYKIMYINSAAVEKVMYYYPIDLELNLINSLKTGDNEQVYRIQEKIYEENYVKRYLTFEMELQLIFSIKGTIFRILDQMDDNHDLLDKIKVIEEADTIQDMFDHLSAINMTICTIMRNQLKNESNILRTKIIKYLNTCYMNADLNLYQVASSFSLTESYIYHFFKDSMGVTFADYLEDIRIRKACELLSARDISIKTVAQQVGYGSDSSFRRAFKRIIGLSPTQYQIAVE